jgi:hypothetical protein
VGGARQYGEAEPGARHSNRRHHVKGFAGRLHHQSGRVEGLFDNRANAGVPVREDERIFGETAGVALRALAIGCSPG